MFCPEEALIQLQLKPETERFWYAATGYAILDGDDGSRSSGSI